MILVTGGTGFLGKELVPELEKIDDVRILSRGKRKTDKRIFKADISKFSDVSEAMKDVDYVFHLAKFKGHNYPYEKHYPTTVRGTENVVAAAVKHNVKKIVHMSTVGVEMENITPYSRAKKEAEDIVMNNWEQIPIPIIRASMIYDKSIISKLRKYTYLPFPYKKQQLHMCYKQPLIKALLNARRFGKSEVYHALDKKCISLVEMMKEIAGSRPLVPIPPQTIYFLAGLGYPVKLMFNLAGKKPPITPEYIKYTFEDRCFDIKKAEKTLKYEPVDTIETIQKIKRGELE